MSSQQQPLAFKTVLITGGGGGLGLAMAKWLLHEEKKKVIIAGRTTSKLEEASSQHLNNCPYYTLDTGAISKIPEFVKQITSEHPDLDCLINNAGVQRPLQIPDGKFDLDKADQEIDINIRGPMHLAIGLLPALLKHDHPTIVNVSSVLGFVPFSKINPVYNGTKAWVHFWTMNLRTQLLQSPGSEKVTVVEIAPPSVETDLHREREDPDDNKKSKNPNSMSVDDFIKEVSEQWKAGREMIAAGMARGMVDRWESTFQADYNKMVGGK